MIEWRKGLLVCLEAYCGALGISLLFCRKSFSILLSVYLSVYLHIHTYIHIDIYIHIHIYTFIHTYIHSYTVCYIEYGLGESEAEDSAAAGCYYIPL